MRETGFSFAGWYAGFVEDLWGGDSSWFYGVPLIEAYVGIFVNISPGDDVNMGFGVYIMNWRSWY